MKYLFTSLLVFFCLIGHSQNKKQIKNLENSKVYFTMYQNLPFEEIFERVPKSRGKTKYYIKKDNCNGVYLVIIRKGRVQLSNYYIVKQVQEVRLYSIQDINDFISKLQHED